MIAAQDEVGGIISLPSYFLFFPRPLLSPSLKKTWANTSALKKKGLFVRPPYEGETYANWEKTAAGMKEDDAGWVYVPPVPDVFTVFPGKFASLP